MNLDFTVDEQRFREEVRDWLQENAPRDPQPLEGAEKRAYDVAWQRKQFDAGWAGINWPKAFGGCGMSTTQQLIWHEEYAKANAPDVGSCFVGLNHGGPTLIARGSEAHQAFHLPKILRGETIWCQGFSEPSSGSDLASLRTRGVLDGDHLVVNGQKIWTSYAHVADYQELLVRTDPDVKKHKGITWIICDMSLPGVEVRPIRTMSGERHFCEVFYDDVRIPLDNVVGEINGGWSVAMSTLSFERGTAFMSRQIALARKVEELIELARKTPKGAMGRMAIDDDEIARKLARLRANVAALQAMTYAAISRNERTGMPGPEGSMIKLSFADLSQDLQRIAAEILGPSMLEYEYGDTGWTHDYLRSYLASIGGGTSEIQKEIIADRVLGMPKGR